ncbi:MAG: hypothetical protein WDZ74_01730 [Candidatus Paceibacterota bacterium]
MSRQISSLHIVRVLPIVRGFRASEATYFSTSPFTPGAIISIPFRNKTKSAVVISSASVAEEKSQIKNADFGLRKIKKQQERFIFNPLFLEAVHTLALHYATTPGEVLSALVPTSILEHIEMNTIFRPESVTKVSSVHTQERIFFQGSTDTQLQAIQNEVQKTLKKKASVLILAQTVDDAKRVSDVLTPLFPEKIIEVSSRRTKKNQQEVWSEAALSKTALVAIVTASFLSIPLTNPGLCIIYKSNSSLFHGQRRPYLDARVALEIIAEKYRASVMTTDVFIPIRETKGKKYSKLDSLPITAKIEMVDMTKTAKTTEERLKNDFVLLSKELLSNTKQVLRSGKNVFWFVARRGLFPATVCRDCGTEHTCQQCGSSLVLHETKAPKKDAYELVGNENRFFLCHRCGEREDTLVTCRACNSWRLLPLGVGIDRVYEKASELGLNPLILSQDHTPTKKSVKETLALFYEPREEKGRLLLGTDLALPHLVSPVALSSVVSVDSRLALPSYTAEESALKTLLSIVSLSNEFFLIQTRRPEHRIFKYLTGRNLNSFRKEEANLRKTFVYPPFGTLVEISYTAKKYQVEERINSISRDLVQYTDSAREKITRFPLRGTKQKGVYKGSVVLKLTSSLKSRATLRSYLGRLSPDIQIRVDPENLW